LRHVTPSHRHPLAPVAGESSRPSGGYYKGLCLLSGVLVTLVIVPINLAQDLPWIISAAALAFGLTSLGLYIGARRRGHYYPTVAWASLMVTLNVIWFPNAGLDGSVSFVFLPAAMFAALFPAEQTLAPAPARGSGCILVVGDEDAAPAGDGGAGAITASDGVEAIKLFATRHHELSGVLLDLKMPRKAGRETFVEMRAIDSAVPVLLCSGYGENEEAQSLISMGAIGLLSKPYRIGELAELLSRFRR